MTRSLKHPLKHSLITVAVAALAATAALVTAAPASAHEAPKPGAACALSGMVEYNHGTVFVCSSKSEGAKPRWAKVTQVYALRKCPTCCHHDMWLPPRPCAKTMAGPRPETS